MTKCSSLVKPIDHRSPARHGGDVLLGCGFPPTCLGSSQNYHLQHFFYAQALKGTFGDQEDSDSAPSKRYGFAPCQLPDALCDLCVDATVELTAAGH